MLGKKEKIMAGWSKRPILLLPSELEDKEKRLNQQKSELEDWEKELEENEKDLKDFESRINQGMLLFEETKKELEEKEIELSALQDWLDLEEQRLNTWRKVLGGLEKGEK